MSILIKQVLFLNKKVDVFIDGNKIKQIADSIEIDANKIIDGADKAIIPGLFNGHTHSAMTLMRGYADDMHLMPWLEEKIWPFEKKITEEDVYWGAKLACLEMIKSGTTLFYDMYLKIRGTVKAVEEMGLRAIITDAGFDFFNPELAKEYKTRTEKILSESSKYNSRITFAMGPHAIYTVSKETLQWIRDFAASNNLLIQTHLSETRIEVTNSINNFGTRPVQYLESIGFLDSNVSLAHCVHLDDTEIKILGNRGCKVIHNPASNMKLSSGNLFRYADLKKAGVTVGIGTDGTASSNNLDMFEAMKLAALLGKVSWDDPTLWPAEETFRCTTHNTESITGIKTGKIEVGYLADLCLIDLNRPELTPNFNLISNLVYSANGYCVDTVICDGKILMENRHVDGEEEILKNAHRIAKSIVER